MRHRQANDREGSQDLVDRFHELADRWEHETWMLSSSAQMAAHPDCKAIVSLGMPAVPLILKRMQTQGGHWYRVLRDITKVNPVAPSASRQRRRDAEGLAALGPGPWEHLSVCTQVAKQVPAVQGPAGRRHVRRCPVRECRAAARERPVPLLAAKGLDRGPIAGAADDDKGGDQEDGPGEWCQA